MRPRLCQAIRCSAAARRAIRNQVTCSLVPAVTVPFNRPGLAGPEFDRMRRAVEGMHLSGDGRFARYCERVLERTVGSARALLTASCTDALEMIGLLLDLQPGDEVLMPSFTFVSTANAFALRGAAPVFVDIRPDTLNLDERLVPSMITPRTRAIVAVHYAGVACEMDALAAAAATHGLALVEDNAHGLFGTYHGRMLGSLGAMAAQSFHETKNVTCGEGGALMINDPRYAARAEILRDKGTDRGRFFRGEVDKYSWVDIGSSFSPSELQAAFLSAQLDGYESIQTRRRAVWERYHDGLRNWADSRGARLPCVPAHCQHAYHMFYVLLPSLAARQSLMAHLKSRGIASMFHYVPLHSSQMGTRVAGAAAADCPVTTDVSNRLLRLPFYNDLSENDQGRVIDAIHEWPGLAGGA